MSSHMLVGHRGKLGQLHKLGLVLELEQELACTQLQGKEQGQGPHTEEQPRPQRG